MFAIDIFVIIVEIHQYMLQPSGDVGKLADTNIKYIYFYQPRSFSNKDYYII